MIEIIVDCNNDTLAIEDTSNHNNVLGAIKIIYPVAIIKLLKILFDKMDNELSVGIKLIKIDEDAQYTIGEW